VAGRKVNLQRPRLIDKGSSKERFTGDCLKNNSTCDVIMNAVAGRDIEHEQVTPDCDDLAPQALPACALVRASLAIIGHMPPCMQQPQAHVDRHVDAFPFTNEDQ
jgi:hypothetical protein